MSVKTNARWSTGRDVVLALVMAIGLSTVFLSPLRFSADATESSTTTVTPGRILGESIVIPLKVPVSIHLRDQRWQVITSPRFGMLAEALSQAAGAAGSSFEYMSRGSSIYLLRFMKVADDTTGVWIVSINGVATTDLSSPSLEQGDEVVIEWSPL